MAFFSKFFAKPAIARFAASRPVRCGVYGFALFGAAIAVEQVYRQGASWAKKNQPTVVVTMIAMPRQGLRQSDMFHKVVTVYSGEPPIAQLEQAGFETAQKLARENPGVIAGTVQVYAGWYCLIAKDIPRSRAILSCSEADGVTVVSRVRDTE